MLGHGAIKAPWPNLLYPPPAGNYPLRDGGLGPEAFGGLDPGGRPVEPDVAQQALVELGQLASRTGKLGAGHDMLDPDHNATGQERHGAAEGEGEGSPGGRIPARWTGST